jgi:hypothetical protein
VVLSNISIASSTYQNKHRREVALGIFIKYTKHYKEILCEGEGGIFAIIRSNS